MCVKLQPTSVLLNLVNTAMSFFILVSSSPQFQQPLSRLATVIASCPSILFLDLFWKSTHNFLWSLCRSTCVSWHLQLRTGWFCWSRVLLPTSPCCRLIAHSD